MNKNKSIDHSDFLSIFLVFTYYIFHNIYLVFIGVILALYSINKDFINSRIKFIDKIENSKREAVIKGYSFMKKEEKIPLP